MKMTPNRTWFVEICEALAHANDAHHRFALFTAALERFGLDQINYGFFDPAEADRSKAEVLFLSTMRADWLQYYYDRALHFDDPHVVKVRQGNVLPYRWGKTEVASLEAANVRRAALEIEDAGIRNSLCIPLASPFAPLRPVAGMTLGSSQDSPLLHDADTAPYLVAITHLFHNLSLGALTRERLEIKPLSAREKDCMQLLIGGLTQDQIAERLTLSRATVELHLRNAKRKLKADSLTQAVARALMFGEIVP